MLLLVLLLLQTPLILLSSKQITFACHRKQIKSNRGFSSIEKSGRERERGGRERVFISPLFNLEVNAASSFSCQFELATIKISAHHQIKSITASRNCIRRRNRKQRVQIENKCNSFQVEIQIIPNQRGNIINQVNNKYQAIEIKSIN